MHKDDGTQALRPGGGGLSWCGPGQGAALCQADTGRVPRREQQQVRRPGSTWGLLRGQVGDSWKGAWGVEEVGRHPVPGGGPPPLGQGPGQEGAGWLSRCPNWFISVADFLLLLCRKCSHGPGGASLGGAGREGRKLTDFQFVLVFPEPFQSHHGPCPWGWVTLDRSLTLSGPQCPSV